MKSKTSVVLVFVLFFAFFTGYSAKGGLNDTNFKEVKANAITNNSEFRGVWVCTVYAMDYPTAYTKNAGTLKKDIDAIVGNAGRFGFNAVIFQVRPAADAFYKSAIFPWSKYLSGTQGQAPDSDFDPLEYIIEKCHQANIELHAWINPYRVTALASDKLISGHIALSNPEYAVDYQGKLYFNPGVEAVRKIIIAGAEEIVKNYNVDGIHFDDYFYPDKSFNDYDTYLKYNKSFSNIEDWRRNNNDLLIEETYKAIKKINANVKFGVSPSGIWANKNSNSLGSATNGFQSYYDIFADSRKWVINNWVDYIIPQVYWNIGFAAADYSVIVDWWANVVKNTDVKLYIGLACYKVDDVSYGAVWQGGLEIERQILLNRNNKQVSGMAFFRYLDVLIKSGIQQQATKYFTFAELTPEAVYPEEETRNDQGIDGLFKTDEQQRKESDTNNKTGNNTAKNNSGKIQFFYFYILAAIVLIFVFVVAIIKKLNIR